MPMAIRVESQAVHTPGLAPLKDKTQALNIGSGIRKVRETPAIIRACKFENTQAVNRKVPLAIN